MSDFNAMQTKPAETQLSAGTKIEESKAIAQIQAHILMAKQWPRNENQVYLNIIEACKRSSLAEVSIYALPRGGKMVTGASIRLAEVLAQKYGNISMKVSITNQDNDKTEGRAIAVDMEVNNIVEREFSVLHKRTTKKGVQFITDEAEIRLMFKSIAARELRECILSIIPGDMIEGALAQCQKTLASSDVPIKEQIRNMIAAFDEMGVKIEHLEKRLKHKLDATIPAEIVNLKSIYKSLKDGMAKREDFFDFGGVSSNAAESVTNLIAAKTETEKKPLELEVSEFEKIKKQILSSKSSDTLDVAVDLVSSLPNEEEQKVLYELYNNRKAALNL